MSKIAFVDNVQHGKVSTYSNNICRSCDACRAAWNEYNRLYSRRRRAEARRLREENAELRAELARLH